MFAADYYGVPHPNVLKALGGLGEKWQRGAYGNDALTRAVQDIVREKFGLPADAGVFFVPTGTAGNLLATATLLTRSWHAIMCADGSHMIRYEAGGGESLGHKIIRVPEENGKIDLGEVAGMTHYMRKDTHQVHPKMLAVANATEKGTVYAQREFWEIKKFAAGNNMLLHMDGSRLAYAMEVTELPEIFRSYGFDTLMLGLTKVGALDVDVLIVADPERARAAESYHKQRGYTGARMQGAAAQVRAMLEDDLWLKNAAHANRMATSLKEVLWHKLRVDVIYPVQTNALFFEFSFKVAEALREGGWAYTWTDPWKIADTCVVRCMTSWATTHDDIDALVAFLGKQLLET